MTIYIYPPLPLTATYDASPNNHIFQIFFPISSRVHPFIFFLISILFNTIFYVPLTNLFVLFTLQWYFSIASNFFVTYFPQFSSYVSHARSVCYMGSSYYWHTYLSLISQPLTTPFHILTISDIRCKISDVGLQCAM